MEEALLYGVDIHPVFSMLSVIIVLGGWYMLQRVQVFGIYIFKIAASAFSTFFMIQIIRHPNLQLFGETVAEAMDTIWTITFAIIYFLICLIVRSNMDDEEWFGDFEMPEFIKKIFEKHKN